MPRQILVVVVMVVAGCQKSGPTPPQAGEAPAVPAALKEIGYS